MSLGNDDRRQRVLSPPLIRAADLIPCSGQFSANRHLSRRSEDAAARRYANRPARIIQRRLARIKAGRSHANVAGPRELDSAAKKRSTTTTGPVSRDIDTGTRKQRAQFLPVQIRRGLAAHRRRHTRGNNAPAVCAASRAIYVRSVTCNRLHRNLYSQRRGWRTGELVYGEVGIVAVAAKKMYADWGCV